MIECINKYFKLTEIQAHQFEVLGDLYKEWNAKINVISRKDIDNIYEHHILHSLSIAKYLQSSPLINDEHNSKRLSVMDLGTGGGFPGIPLAIIFPTHRFCLIDSIGKKVKVTKAIGDAIGLKNCKYKHIRAQEDNSHYDIVVSRAVMELNELVKIVRKKTDCLICLKGGNIEEEIYKVKDCKSKINLLPISNFFTEEWFADKYIVEISNHSGGLLKYDLGIHTEAFSTENGSDPPYHVIQPHQTHTDNIAVITDASISREDLQNTDALITNLTNCAIGVRTADCVPILLYDCANHAVAAIHSGWRGTVKKIVQKAIILMQKNYGTDASILKAIIGPSISVDSFQVGNEVVEAFHEAGFPMDVIHKVYHSTTLPGNHIDLWEANKWLLCESGVKLENIHISGICTYTHHTHFYSARRDGNNHDQRIITAIKLI